MEYFIITILTIFLCMIEEISQRLTGNDARMDRFRKVWIAVDRTVVVARDPKFLCKIVESDSSSSTVFDRSESLRGDEERSEGKDKLHLKIALLLRYNYTPSLQNY